MPSFPDASAEVETLLENGYTASSRLRWAETEKIYRKALSLMPDKNSLMLGYTLTQCGYACVRQQKYEDAEILLQRAVSVLESCHKDNRFLPTALDRKGDLHRRIKDFDKAEQCKARTDADCQQSTEAAGILEVLTRSRNASRRSAPLSRIGCGVSEGFDKAGEGMNDYYLAFYLPAMAHACNETGDAQTAERLLKRAFTVYRGMPYIPRTNLVYALTTLSEIYKHKGKVDDGNALVQAADEVHNEPLTVTNARSLLSTLPIDMASTKQAEPPIKNSDVSSVGSQAIHSEQQSSQAQNNQSLSDKPVTDKWALICGIRSFQDSTIPTLKYADKDARDFYDFLIHKANFAPDHVRLLLNEKATQRRILTELGDKFLPRVVRPDDLVVVYFSGHGSPSSVDVANENFLIAYDSEATNLFASGIDMQEFARLIKSRVRSNRVLIFLDACHSGSADAHAKGVKRSANFDAQEIAQGSGQLVLCSSLANERSWESTHYPNGIFTKKLIEGLQQDGTKTKLSNAFNFLHDQVQTEVHEDHGIDQTPILNSKWNGNDIVLGAPPTQPRPLPDSVKAILLPDSAGSPTTVGNGASPPPKHR